MRHLVLSRPSCVIIERPPSLRCSAWARAEDAMHEALVEAAVHGSRSPRSRLSGRVALRERDARLRRDVGLDAVPPDAGHSVVFEGNR